MLGSSMRLSVWEEVKVNNIIDVDVQVFAIRKISDKKNMNSHLLTSSLITSREEICP